MSDSLRDQELQPLGGPPSLGPYLRSVWERRQYAIALPMADLKAAHMNTVLGNLWHLLNPLLSIGVYYLVFGVLLSVDRGVDNFIAFLAVGIFSYRFTQSSIQRGSSSITRNSGLIRSIYFPRALLPISDVVEQVLLLAPSVVVMFLIAVLTGESPLLTWLLIPMIFALQALFNLGGAFIAARISDLIEDFQNLIPFVFRLLFYASGVIFSVEAYVTDPGLQWLFVGNPLYCFITMARWAVLGLPLQANVVVSACIWTAALLVLGFFFFKSGEPRYGRG